MIYSVRLVGQVLLGSAVPHLVATSRRGNILAEYQTVLGTFP